ncbi:MAG: glycoside hydrolase family 78 protein [Phycisphaeraceae bacterium]|nr:glycoside hydrolase family 78 protein [Phycisphaeraceae bacterium]
MTNSNLEQVTVTNLCHAPSGLRVDAATADRVVLGHHRSRPTLSWILPAGWANAQQSAYQIVAASSLDGLLSQPDLWDSGKVTTAQSLFVPWGAKPLTSRQYVCWRVRVWDELDVVSQWSESAEFEVGLLKTSDWSAHWIAAPGEPSLDHRPCPQFRRTFNLDQPVTSARLHVTARGLYQIHLNGRCVSSRDALTPGWTDFDRRVHALTYDVTEQLNNGNNAIGAVLGDGWYYGMGHLGSFMRPQDLGIYGKTPQLLLQLEIMLADGSTQRIVSDEHWKCHEGPIRYSSIYNGEHYEAAFETPGWTQPDFDDAAWQEVACSALEPQTNVEPKPMPAVRGIEERSPISVTRRAPGRFIFDLGQNLVGWQRISSPGRRGQKITIRFAEMLLDNGELYTENYRHARSTDELTPAADGPITWTPAFTFHGFRYVELSGLAPNVEPSPDMVTAIVLHTPMQKIGSFTSSHAKLNQLQSNITWGQRGNFLEVPTDCPQRDERLGWTGDAQVFCPTSCFNYDTLAFWRKWLIDLADSQREDGALPHVAPDIMNRSWKKRGERQKDYAAAGWADAGVIVPWEVYVRYGDRGVLEQSYPMMCRWVDFCARQANDFILKQAIFGDWLQPYPQTFAPDNTWDARKGDTPEELIATAYLGQVSGLLARVARVLNKHEDAVRYLSLRDKVRQAFIATFFDGNGRLTVPCPTQAGYLLALGFDMLPEKMRPAAVENLVKLVHEADDHLRTGFLGTPLLCPVLDRFGYSDLAYTLLLRETYPSWFFSINQGATTMWERWNSYSKADGFGDARMNSFNHYAYGAIGQWMYERVAGLAPDPEQPGYKHIIVRPVPGGGLTHAAAELQTLYGRAVSAWRREGADFKLQVVVPPNTSATVTLPDGSTPHRLGPGEHQLHCRLS